jgi:uncharacterized protein (DUF2062 family)
MRCSSVIGARTRAAHSAVAVGLAVGLTVAVGALLGLSVALGDGLGRAVVVQAARTSTSATQRAMTGINPP